MYSVEKAGGKSFLISTSGPQGKAAYFRIRVLLVSVSKKKKKKEKKFKRQVSNKKADNSVEEWANYLADYM